MMKTINIFYMIRHSTATMRDIRLPLNIRQSSVTDKTTQHNKMATTVTCQNCLSKYDRKKDNFKHHTFVHGHSRSKPRATSPK